MDLKNPVWEHQAQEAYGNENPKIPRVEISKKAFKAEERKHLETIYGKKAVEEVLGPIKPKKKLNDLDKYLILSFTCIILFTIATLVIFCITGNEPAVLVGCFFGAFGGETVICARIKKYKLHKEAELKKDDGDTFT